MQENTIILETPRLQLREFCRQDAAALAAVLSDPEAMRFYPEPLDRRAVVEWIDRNRRRYAKDGFGLWAMVLKSSGELIGDCGLVRQSVNGNQEFEIGYHVRRDLWGRGLAPEAARACRDFGFKKLEVERLISLIRPENLPSRRVAEKNGMTVREEILWYGMAHLVYAIERPNHPAAACPGLPSSTIQLSSNAMRKAAVLYNPLSGRRQNRRLEDLKKAVDVLRAAGVEVVAVPTLPDCRTASLVEQAIEQGCDTVFACGGDGTVHDVLQGLAETETALGIIPLGTANALAHDLGLPLSPAAAARAALTAKPRRIALGRVNYRDLSGNLALRYFTVTLGAGVDAHLFYQLNPEAKLRLGMMAYYAKATWLWLTHDLPRFPVSFAGPDGEARQAEVSEILAVRIANFGGVLRELAPGAVLDRDDLRLVLFHTRSRIAYLHYIVRGLVGAKWTIPGIELVHATSVACQQSAHSSPTYVEADGEILGTLPAEITVVPDALTILTPSP